MAKDNKIKKYAESIDYFGMAPTMNFKGGSSSKSLFGSFISILSLGLAIWSIWYFGKDIYQRQNPNVVVSTTIVSNATTFKLGAQNDFIAAIGLMNNSNMLPIVDLTIYEVQAVLINIQPPNSPNTLPVIKITPLETDLCQQSDLGPIVGLAGKAYCLDAGGADKYEIADWKQVFIQFRIVRCDSPAAKSGATCKSTAEINQVIGGSLGAFYYSDIALELDNYDNPVTSLPNVLPFFLHPQASKAARIELQEMEMTTDKGFLFEDKSTKSYAALGSKTPEILAQNPQFAFAVSLSVSSSKTSYERSYIKLQEIVAEVNGMVALAIMIILIGTKVHLENNFYESLINEIYDVSLDFKNNKGFKGNNNSSKKGCQGEQNQTDKKDSSGPIPQDTSTLNEVHIKQIIEDENQLNQTTNKLIKQNGSDDYQPYHIHTVDKQDSIAKPFKDDFASPNNSNLIQGQINNSNEHDPLENLFQHSPEKIQASKIDVLQNSSQPADTSSHGGSTNVQQVIPSNRNDDIEANNMLKKEKLKQSQQITQNNNENNLSQHPQSLPKSEEEIHLNFAEWLISKFPCQTRIKKKSQLLQKGKDQLDARLDIISIMKQLQQFEKLKNCLLDDKQLLLFNELPKPLLQVEEINNQEDEYQLNESSKVLEDMNQQQKREAVEKVYLELKSQENISSFDLKLIKMYESAKLKARAF